MFAGVARFVVRHPIWVIVVWVVAAVVVIGFAPKLTSTDDEASFLPTHYESIQAINLQQKAFPQAATPAAIIVFERADGGKLTDADSAKVVAIAKRCRRRRSPTSPASRPPRHRRTSSSRSSPCRCRSRRTRTTRVPSDAVKALRTDLQAQLPGTDLKSGITGTAAQTLDSQASGNRANIIIGVATIGLILVLLLIIFRSPIIALLPIITIGVVSQIATGLIGWANNAFNLKTDSSVSAFLIVVLFGVGTDYILFLMFRYRERLRAGEDPKTAMISAVTRVGEAIASAAGAVIIAFLALTLSTLGLFKSLGPALAIAVATTLLAGLTLIPAIVSLLGTKVFWPSKAWKTEPTGARFAAIGALARPPPGPVRRRLRRRAGHPGHLRARVPPELRPQRRLHLERVRVDGLAERTAQGPARRRDRALGRLPPVAQRRRRCPSSPRRLPGQARRRARASARSRSRCCRRTARSPTSR